MTRLQRKVKTLQKKIGKSRDKTDLLSKELRDICPHATLEKTGGGIWHNYPEWGHYPIRYWCRDCQTQIKSADYLPSELDKRVVSDRCKYE